MKNFLAILSFFGIVSAQFNDPAEFSVKIDDVNQGEVGTNRSSVGSRHQNGRNRKPSSFCRGIGHCHRKGSSARCALA